MSARAYLGVLDALPVVFDPHRLKLLYMLVLKELAIEVWLEAVSPFMHQPLQCRTFRPVGF